MEVNKSDEPVVTDETLVCSECGGTSIQVKVWIDANTGKFKSSTEGDSSDQWCDDCESHTQFMHHRDFVKSQNPENS